MKYVIIFLSLFLLSGCTIDISRPQDKIKYEEKVKEESDEGVLSTKEKPLSEGYRSKIDLFNDLEQNFLTRTIKVTEIKEATLEEKKLALSKGLKDNNSYNYVILYEIDLGDLEKREIIKNAFSEKNVYQVVTLEENVVNGILKGKIYLSVKEKPFMVEFKDYSSTKHEISAYFEEKN